jgi:CubicO group peptidase (beta-lactamase class C family)
MASRFPSTTRLLRQGLEEQRYTAGVVHIASARGDLLREAVGCLDPAAPESTTQLDSVFDLASLTKVFVAAAVMRAVEQGRLSLETRVGDVAHLYAGRPIGEATIWHLLTHTSGLPASFDIYSTGEWAHGRDVVLAKLAGTALTAEPGHSLLYSDLGYVLLGHALEEACGASLDRCLDALLFEPAGWSDIWFNPPQAVRPRVAATEYSRPRRGHTPRGVVHDGTAFALGGVAGHAGLFASTEAITELGRQTLLAWDGEPGPPLSRASLRQMSSVAVERGGMRRGLGWHFNHGGIYDSGAPFSRRAFGHTGFTGTSVWVDPEANVVVTLLTNRVFSGEGKPGGIRFNVWRAAFHKAVLDDLHARCAAQ